MSPDTYLVVSRYTSSYIYDTFGIQNIALKRSSYQIHKINMYECKFTEH